MFFNARKMPGVCKMAEVNPLVPRDGQGVHREKPIGAGRFLLNINRSEHTEDAL